jgi:hypothetical protein
MKRITKDLTEADYLIEKLAGRLPNRQSEQFDELKKLLAKSLVGKTIDRFQAGELIDYIQDRARLPDDLTYEEWKARKKGEQQ